MSCNDCATGELGWDVFAPYIAPYVKGAPDVLMAHTARLAAIEFARETGVVRRDLHIDAQAGVADYPLDAGDCYTVTAIKAVCVDCKPVKVMRGAMCSPGCRTGYRFDAPRDLFLYPAPAQDGCENIRVTAVLIPGQDSCVVDPILYNEFAELIGDGAVSRLLMMKASSWYEPQAANTFLAKFLAAVRKAKLSLAKERSLEPQFMKGSRFI